jgi:hypothetical protein
MTDDQRLERLIAYNEKHSNPPKPQKEILDIWEWIKKTHTGRRQEERDKREDEKRTPLDDNMAELTPIIAAEIPQIHSLGQLEMSSLASKFSL